MPDLNLTYEEAQRGRGSDPGESNRQDGTFAEARLLGNISYLSLPESIAGFDWVWNANASAQPFYREDDSSGRGGF